MIIRLVGKLTLKYTYSITSIYVSVWQQIYNSRLTIKKSNLRRCSTAKLWLHSDAFLHQKHRLPIGIWKHIDSHTKPSFHVNGKYIIFVLSVTRNKVVVRYSLNRTKLEYVWMLQRNSRYLSTSLSTNLSTIYLYKDSTFIPVWWWRNKVIKKLFKVSQI